MKCRSTHNPEALAQHDNGAAQTYFAPHVAVTYTHYTYQTSLQERLDHPKRRRLLPHFESTCAGLWPAVGKAHSTPTARSCPTALHGRGTKNTARSNVKPSALGTRRGRSQCISALQNIIWYILPAAAPVEPPRLKRCPCHATNPHTLQKPRNPALGQALSPNRTQHRHAPHEGCQQSCSPQAAIQPALEWLAWHSRPRMRGSAALQRAVYGYAGCHGKSPC